MTICSMHPGGRRELPADAFYPSDQHRKIARCKACRAAAKKNTPPAAEPQAILLSTPGPVRKIGNYFIHEQALLIADAMQAGKIVLFTSILEIDGDTKHPRNKRVTFTQQHAPEEYRACMAWLESLSGVDAPTSDAERDTALQLADEATQKLIAAQAEIAELKAALAPLKALLGKASLNGSPA